MSTYTLHYFDLYARGEAIRLLLAHSGAKWEDHRIQFNDWPAIKPTMVGGQLPNLELADGTKLNQALAILRFLGAKHGYYPNDPWLAAQVDELVYGAMDVFEKLPAPLFAADKEPLIEAIMTTILPNFLKGIDKHFTTSKWLVGDKITIADFLIGSIYISYVANPNVGYGKDRYAQLLA